MQFSKNSFSPSIIDISLQNFYVVLENTVENIHQSYQIIYYDSDASDPSYQKVVLTEERRDTNLRTLNFIQTGTLNGRTINLPKFSLKDSEFVFLGESRDLNQFF